jgi:hypothetical protein
MSFLLLWVSALVSGPCRGVYKAHIAVFFLSLMNILQSPLPQKRQQESLCGDRLCLLFFKILINDKMSVRSSPRDSSTKTHFASVLWLVAFPKSVGNCVMCVSGPGERDAHLESRRQDADVLWLFGLLAFFNSFQNFVVSQKKQKWGIHVVDCRSSCCQKFVGKDEFLCLGWLSRKLPS